MGRDSKAWNHAHPEAMREAHRKWRDKHSKQRRLVGTVFIREQKQGKLCSVCGESNIDLLEFHHIDKTTKRAEVSQMLLYAKGTILAEIAKCILLCRSCHGKHHNPA